jgi:hypothetical protein
LQAGIEQAFGIFQQPPTLFQLDERPFDDLVLVHNSKGMVSISAEYLPANSGKISS